MSIKIKGRKRTPRNSPRTCGECRACCITLGFQAREGEAPFDKPHGVPCPHLSPAGCVIYGDHPLVCQRFQCGWIQAPNLPDALRPDRCGVLFCANSSPLGEGEVVYAYELVPGAADTGLPAWLIGELSAATTVILVREDRCEVLTADPQVQARLEQGTGSRSG